MILQLRSIRRNPWAGWLLRLAFAAFLLTLLFTQIDVASVLNTLTLVNVRALVPIFVLYFFVRYIWAYQMSLGLIPLRIHFTVLHLFKIILISSFYSLILPGNILAGGTASWYKLSRHNRKGIEAGALLIYFRAVNTLTLLGIGLVGMWFDSHLSSPRFRATTGAVFVGVVLLSLPFFSPKVTHRIERLGEPLLHRLSLPAWIQDKGRAVWKALTAFQSLKKGTIALVFGLSLLSHALGIFLYYLLALAVGIRLSVFVMGWIRSVVAIIQMVPISIAGLGMREVSLVLLLRGYGIPEAKALSFSLVVFGVMVVGGLVGGLLEGWDLLLGRYQARPQFRTEWRK
jgi:uncharacterized protein (TIRG00374 family)